MREVAIFDERFVSRFEWLRQRPKDVATPPIYMAFDCLYVNGRDLRPQGLRERRQSLEKVIADQSLILPARRLALDGPSGVGGSPATKGWQGPQLTLRGRAHGRVAQGETGGLPSGGARLDPNGLIGHAATDIRRAFAAHHLS